MPRKTDGEKIDALETLVATLIERIDTIRKDLDAAGKDRAEAAKTLTAMEKEVLLLKRDVDDFKKWKDDLKKKEDESSRRLWAFGPNIVGAVVSVLLSATVGGLVAYFTSRR
jgi:predicted  nucleic acid-binding Zn-ribbon protein